MKILYISNSRIPTEKAYGIQIMNMCAALAEGGIETELILPTRKSKIFKQIEVFNYYQLKPNFKLKKLCTPDPNFLMSLPHGLYIKIQSFLFISRLCLYLLFKKNKNDYVFYTRDEYLLPLLLKFSKKIFWEAHSLPSKTSHYLSYWCRCASIVAITTGLKNDLIKLGLPEEKIIVAPDGVDLNKFNITVNKIELRKKFNLPADKKIVMYAGHLYTWKGVQTLVETEKFLSDDILIVFVGGTEFDLNNFKIKNNELFTHKKILFLGHLAPREIPEILTSADCLVLPNSAEEIRSEKYTSPLKMFEYMASGKPVVASDLPSIREILNEKNATFFKPDDSKDLAEKIKDVLNNLQLAEKKAIQAKEDVKNYTWQKRAEKILNFIKK